MKQKAPSLFDWNIAGPAIVDAFKKLNPRLMIKNPVMFVTMVGAALTTVGIFTAPAQRSFIAQLALWLWSGSVTKSLSVTMTSVFPKVCKPPAGSIRVTSSVDVFDVL